MHLEELEAWACAAEEVVPSGDFGIGATGVLGDLTGKDGGFGIFGSVCLGVGSGALGSGEEFGGL